MFKNGSASLTNSTISEGKGYGIVIGQCPSEKWRRNGDHLKSEFSFNNYANNRITGHELEPILSSFEGLDDLDTESSYSGNDLDQNYVYCCQEKAGIMFKNGSASLTRS